VGDIINWADILRLVTGPGGAQPSAHTAKVHAIKRFLQDADNTIPTAVIIALNLPAEARVVEGGEVRKLRFTHEPNSPKVGVVIDGQHRLLGMKEFEPSLRAIVVALLTGDENEAAFQFLVINNKASKVPTDHIKALLAERQDPRLQERLTTARLSIDRRYEFVGIADTDPESPFRSTIDWPTNRTGPHLVKPAAIETAVRDIQERKIREFEESDTPLDYFFTLWREVKGAWADLWVADSKLLSKVGIVCMTQYVTDSAASSYDLGQLDITNPEAVRRRTQELLTYQKKEFWTANWSLAGKDNAAGRKAVVDALVQVARNTRAGREWSEDVELLESEPD
jgi:DGQHR domain-containing protein